MPIASSKTHEGLVPQVTRPAGTARDLPAAQVSNPMERVSRSGVEQKWV